MELIDKIKSKNANVGVVGLGYVGLPLVMEFCKAGFHVTGFDIDEKKVVLLKQGKSYIKHIDSSRVAKCLPQFLPTNDFSRLSGMDCIVICVPTPPLNKNREPDMDYVFDTTKTIARYLRKGQLISLESTTYPGTTDEDMRAILEETGLKAGKDFYLAFSPEREDPNNNEFSTSTIPKVVGGYTEKCLAVAISLYNTIVVKTVPVSSTKAAEATKLLENIFRSVNIALVNELKMLFDEINTYMPHYVVEKTKDVLNKGKKAVNGSKTLVLGIAYKKNVDDQRESPSLKIIELLSLGQPVANHCQEFSYVKTCEDEILNCFEVNGAAHRRSGTTVGSQNDETMVNPCCREIDKRKQAVDLKVTRKVS